MRMGKESRNEEQQGKAKRKRKFRQGLGRAEAGKDNVKTGK